jgi:predicted ATPase
MLILTYSEQNGRKEHFLKGMKQELLVHRQCAEIVLTPLSKRAIVQMLTAELQVGLEKNNSKHLESDDAPTAVEQCVTMDLASFVHRHSEGNPLFALAIMDHLKHQGILVRKRSANTYCWESRIPFEEIKSIVPEGLAQMIELEVQTLPPKEQRLLEAGSLMTIAFPAWVVAAALNEDPQSIEDACDQLSRQLHFLNRIGQDELPDGTSSDVYIFTHGLYREVLYQRQSASRRARRHIRIAARLSEIFADREGNVAREIALHYEAASNWPRAVDLQLQAARHARDRQAPWESVQLLEHALRLAENLCEPERKQALLTVRNELSISREAMHSGSLQQISASS